MVRARSTTKKKIVRLTPEQIDAVQAAIDDHRQWLNDNTGTDAELRLLNEASDAFEAATDA